MGRYDRKRTNKSNKPTFLIFPIVVALLIGIGGTYFVMKNYKPLVESEIPVANEAQLDGIETPENTSADLKIPGDGELEFVPSPEEPETDSGTNASALNLPSDLPDLLSSDDLVSQVLIKLSPGLAKWLGSDLLIRKYVVIANDFAQGIRVYKHMSFLRHATPFTVDEESNGLYIASPSSFKRYDVLAQAIQAIDANTAVVIYQKFRPLMLQVFSEFSYPKDITLESIVKKALAEIIAAPAIDEKVNLVRPSAFYKFADPTLEALSSVQKQMIRMGPDNTRIIQSKCREFLVALGKANIE